MHGPGTYLRLGSLRNGAGGEPPTNKKNRKQEGIA